jgi:hypothetical protein
MDESITGHVSTHCNLADLALQPRGSRNKVLPGGQKRDGFIGLILYDLTAYD